MEGRRNKSRENKKREGTEKGMKKEKEKMIGSKTDGKKVKKHGQEVKKDGVQCEFIYYTPSFKTSRYKFDRTGILSVVLTHIPKDKSDRSVDLLCQSLESVLCDV